MKQIYQTLPRKYIPQFWKECRRLLDEAITAKHPELQYFKGFKLFCSAKNVKKVIYEESGDVRNLVKTMKREVRWILSYANQWIFQYFNWRFIDPDKFWIDLAIIHFIAVDRITLIWKGSFLEKKLKAFGNPRQFMKSFYNWCHTRDIGSMGFELYGKGSKNWKRIDYSQYYLVIKNESSASYEIYPWPEKCQNLEYLQLPDVFVKSMMATEYGKIRFTSQDCNEWDMKTGRRILLNTQRNDRRSYGVRQEYRISISLLGEVIGQLKEMSWPSFGQMNEDALPFFI